MSIPAGGSGIVLFYAILPIKGSFEGALCFMQRLGNKDMDNPLFSNTCIIEPGISSPLAFRGKYIYNYHINLFRK